MVIHENEKTTVPNISFVQFEPWFIRLQLLSWGGITLITLLTLTLWYVRDGWPIYEPWQTIAQNLFGAALSFLIKPVFDEAWEDSMLTRILTYLPVILAVACVWTLAKISMHAHLTNQPELWNEFGGWNYASLFVLLFWSALYCGARYYVELEEEHKLVLKAEAASIEEHIKRISAESVAKESQLEMLRYQLNPHFLFNTLNSVNALVQMGENQDAQKMVVKLSEMLRYTLSLKTNELVPIEQELQMLSYYFEIEQTRFSDRLTVSLKVTKPARDCLVPSMILQPLAENAIKYAIAPSENTGWIKIDVRTQKNQLIMEILDSGAPEDIASSLDTNSTGVGHNNINDRLAWHFPDEYDFKSKRRKDGGYIATIAIPITRQNDYDQA